MKHYIFIYAMSCDYICWQNQSFEGIIHIEKAEFPKGTSDWEIVEAAYAMEVEREHRLHNCAGENYFSQKLVRVLEIARELDAT